MRVGLIIACVVATLIPAGRSWAQDSFRIAAVIKYANRNAATSVPATSSEAPQSPYIHPKFSPQLQEKLQTAVQIALDRIEEVEECGEMFSILGADGSQALNGTLYIPVAAHNRKDGICRKAAAYTKVGARTTFVCPEFWKLSDEKAAMFVVHEALHHAGLSEKPQDRRAMTSHEINSMVGSKCKF
jgi:hypothetical protein